LANQTFIVLTKQFEEFNNRLGEDTAALLFSADHMKHILERALLKYRHALRTDEPALDMIESHLNYLELARKRVRAKYGDGYITTQISEEDRGELGVAFLEAFSDIMEEIFHDSDPASLSEKDLEELESAGRVKTEFRNELKELLNAYDPILGGSKFRSGGEHNRVDEFIQSELDRDSYTSDDSYEHQPKESGWKKFFKGAAKFAGEVTAGYAALKATAEAAEQARLAKERKQSPGKRMILGRNPHDKSRNSNNTVFGGWCPKCKCSTVWSEPRDEVYDGMVMRVPCEACGTRLRAKAPNPVSKDWGNECEITLL
jgi:hypothetical protein